MKHSAEGIKILWHKMKGTFQNSMQYKMCRMSGYVLESLNTFLFMCFKIIQII
jgi:hypothetical protein